MKDQIKFSAKQSLLSAICLLAVSIQSALAAGDLYHREVNQKNPGGKDLVLTFQELKHDQKTSTIKVTMTSGASVPSAMFIMRGFYDLALARKAEHFIKLSEKEEKNGS